MRKLLTVSSQPRLTRQSLPDTKISPNGSLSPTSKTKAINSSLRGFMLGQSLNQKPIGLYSPNQSLSNFISQDGITEDRPATAQKPLSARNRQSLDSKTLLKASGPPPAQPKPVTANSQKPKILQPAKRMQGAGKPLNAGGLPSTPSEQKLRRNFSSMKFVPSKDLPTEHFHEDSVNLDNESKALSGEKLATYESEAKNSPFDAGSEINYRGTERLEESSLTKSHFFFKKEGQHLQENNTYRGLGLDASKEKENRIYRVSDYKLEERNGDQDQDSNEDSDRKDLIDYNERLQVVSKPISLGMFKKLEIPKFAHHLSHQKIYDSKSFERRLEKSPDTGVLKHKNKENVSIKSFYFDILKELEQTPTQIEHDGQIDFVLTKAEKVDQVTFSIVQEKLGTRYSKGLYHIFTKYALTGNSTARDRMNFSKLLSFMKDFGLFNKDIRQETVSLMFSKRCPSKLIDFPAFVDILFRISRVSQPLCPSKNETNAQFQEYLDKNILNQHNDVLEKQLSPRHPRVFAFGKEYAPENESLRILEGHDDLLKHIFTLYKSLDIQYSSKSIIKLKDFRTFCQDFTLIPVLANLNEMHEIFRRFQLQEKPVVDFRGFILALCCIANIGFEKEVFKQRFDSYGKKLMKFFEFLVEMSNRLSSQLIANNINKVK